MIGDLAKEYYGILEEQTAVCDAQENWDDCIAQCDRFLSAFTNDAYAKRPRCCGPCSKTRRM
jgi:hypothetical protein